MARVSLTFDGLTADQLREVCATYAQFKHAGLSVVSDLDGVVVKCDGPKLFGARVPHLSAESALDFTAIAFKVTPMADWERELLGLTN